MFNILISGVAAVFILTISNLIVVKADLSSYKEMFMIAIYILPLQFLIGLFLTYYYNQGYNLGLSYPLLLMVTYGLGITLAVLSQYFILNNTIKLLDIISITIISIGIGIYIYGKMYIK